MSIKAGRYIITNVKQRSVALLSDPNDGTTLQASYRQDIPGERWDIIDRRNGKFSIVNVGHAKRFANCGVRAQAGEQVEGNDKEQLWYIQETSVRGQIATTDTRMYWALPDEERGTPVTLFDNATDPRGWWTFDSESGSDAQGDPLPTTKDSMIGAVSVVITPPLFALIIGINKYKSSRYPSLRGAVPDAGAVKGYLEETLGVQPSQIKTLYDAEATRSAIIQELCAFQTDPRIQRGNPILIFFAGHGATGAAPIGWEAGGANIQLLVPYDYLCEDNGRTIHGIPDRTIGVLLEKIAKAKGDNITVILDCCHSGSGTRGHKPSSGRFVRGIEMAIDVPPDLDQEVWSSITGTRGTAIQPGFLHHGLQSHVLLAACGAEEEAKEEGGRGLFTKALLGTLVTAGTDMITYADLIQRIPSLHLQNPQCEGYNRDRTWFNSKAPTQRRNLYRVRMNGEEYVMEAGAAHGITDGAEFTLYDGNESPSRGHELCTMMASKPSPFSTTMSILSASSPVHLTEPAFALQTRTGKEEDLRVHVDAKLMDLFLELAREMQRRNPAQQGSILVAKDKAELDITLESGRVVFNSLNPLAIEYGLTRMPFRVSPAVDDVFPIIRAAAHYHWHLRRTSDRKILQNKVQIELTRVKEVKDEDDDTSLIIRPYGPNLNREGVIDLIVDDDTMYGIKIVNNSAIPLYPSLFFFNNSDWSITPYFQPPTSGGKVDAPLRSKGSITIGYGSGGAPPFIYSLKDRQDMEIGFLKLYLSTKQVDLSYLSNASPLSRNTRATTLVTTAPTAIWDTILVPVIQRRSTYRPDRSVQ